MAFNENQLRDKNGQWTDDGIPNYIRSKIIKNVENDDSPLPGGCPHPPF